MIITTAHAAELHQLCENWLKSAKPHMTASARVRFLRTMDFPGMQEDRYPAMRDHLRSLAGVE